MSMRRCCGPSYGLGYGLECAHHVGVVPPVSRTTRSRMRCRASRRVARSPLTVATVDVSPRPGREPAHLDPGELLGVIAGHGGCSSRAQEPAHEETGVVREGRGEADEVAWIAP